MPRKVIHISWGCNLCHGDYGWKKDAQTCEDQGLAVPEFKMWDLVFIKLKDGRKIIGEVTSYGPDDGFPNPHLLPGYYDVNVAYRDYNPDNHKWPENNPLRRHGITVSREMMMLYLIKSISSCPLCGSTDVRNEVEKTYNPYCLSQFSFLVDVELSRCNNCKLYFFNEKQSDLVAVKIRDKLKGKKLADTNKLAKELQYEYS